MRKTTKKEKEYLPPIEEQEPSKQEVFSTFDIHLASALSATGEKIIEVLVDRKQFPYRGEFMFVDSLEFRKKIDLYYQKDLPVDAYTLYNEFRATKARTQV